MNIIGIEILSAKVRIRGEVHRSHFRVLSLASMIDLEDKPMACALSALLEFLQSTIFNMDDGYIFVSAIKPLPMTSYLRLDSQTFNALQIFREDQHPNVLKGEGRKKEGFSLFSILDRTISLPGATLIDKCLKYLKIKCQVKFQPKKTSCYFRMIYIYVCVLYIYIFNDIYIYMFNI